MAELKVKKLCVQQLINEDGRLAKLDLETRKWYGSVIAKHG